MSKLEAIRCEYEATLTVLSARAGSANDKEDWSTILNQTWNLLKLARKALKEAEKQ